MIGVDIVSTALPVAAISRVLEMAKARDATLSELIVEGPGGGNPCLVFETKKLLDEDDFVEAVYEALGSEEVPIAIVRS